MLANDWKGSVINQLISLSSQCPDQQCLLWQGHGKVTENELLKSWHTEVASAASTDVSNGILGKLYLDCSLNPNLRIQLYTNFAQFASWSTVVLRTK